MQSYNFSTKVGKKKQEKLEKDKKKESMNISGDIKIDFNPVEEEFKEQIKLFKDELQKIQIGKLNISSFDKYSLTAYGERQSIQQLAQIVPKSQTSVQINVYDESLTGEIFKTLENANPNFQLKREGKALLCTLLGANSLEIKKQAVLEAKQILENFKTGLKKVRTKHLEQNKKLMEFALKDQVIQINEELNKISAQYTKEIEELFKKKEKELLSS